MKWKDPREYAQSLDPLEFALSILNEVSERDVVNGNDARDDGLPGFPEARPRIIQHLDRISRAEESVLIVEARNETGLPLAGLTLARTPDGDFVYRKSIHQRTKAAHRWLTIVAVACLLEHPSSAARKERLSRCSYCGRFYFHSQRRTNPTPCSTACKTGKLLSSRDRVLHAEYERTRRAHPKGAREILINLGK